MRSVYLICNIVLTASIAAAQSTCISPTYPDPNLAACSECAGGNDKVSGTQCVRANGQRWLSCYPSYEKCCNDGEVKNKVSFDQCMAKSNPNPDVPPTLPPVDSAYCTQVVSTTTSKDNSYCMQLCDTLVGSGVARPESDADFSASCTWAHWHVVNGRSVVDGDCFEKWIYGYSESDRSSYDMDLVTDTPAKCQLLCQKDDKCENWAWVTELYATTGADVVHRCSLKNRKMVEVPLGIVTEALNPPNMNVDFCNYGMPHECSTNHYKCLPCEGGKKRCVWESDMHISGWKYCVPHDSCTPLTEPNLTPKPPATTTTTPAPPVPTTTKAAPAPETDPPAPPPASTTRKASPEKTESDGDSSDGDKTHPSNEKTDSGDSDSDSSDGDKTEDPGNPKPPGNTRPTVDKTESDSDSSDGDKTHPGECHPETTEGGECGPESTDGCEPKPEPCHCHHHHDCPCHRNQLYVKVGEKPKHLLIELEN